jgi:PAS domain S-box-containing protein
MPSVLPLSRRYGMAVLCVGVGIAVCLALDPVLGPAAPILLLTLAVLVAARVYGRGPALVATVLSVWSDWFLFIEPRLSANVTDARDIGGIALMAVVGVAVSFLASPASPDPRVRSVRRGILPDGGPVLRVAILASVFLVAAIVVRMLMADLAREQAQQGWVNHAYPVLNEIRHLQTMFGDADAVKQEYLLSGAGASLERYRKALGVERSTRQLLGALTADNPAQQRQLRQLDGLIHVRFPEPDRLMLLRRGGNAETRRETLDVAAGRRIADQCGATLDAIDAEEDRLLATRAAAARRQGLKLRWVLGLGFGSLFVLLIVAAGVIERDAWNRDQANRAVRESEERLHLALAASNAGTFEWDLATNRNVWSKECWNLYGIAENSCEPSYEAWRKVVHPDDLAAAERVVTEAAAAQTELNVEFRVNRPDGTVWWLLSRAQPVSDGHGNVRFSGIVLDITERKRAEEAIRESEAQFRNLANAIPQLCWMAHADGGIFWYNQRWYDYSGTTPEQMEGWGWQSVHDPEVLPGVLERWRACIATGDPFDMVVSLRASDGVFRPFLTRIVPVLDDQGRIARWFGTNTDISEQRRTEDALRVSEERFRLAQQAAAIGTFELNLETGVATWTPEIERIYGLPPGGSPRAQQDWENLIHPDDLARTSRYVRQTIETGDPGEAEWRVIRPDGIVRWVSGRWQVFKNAAGVPVRLTGVHLDVTDQKAAESALRESQAQMKAALASMTDAVSISDAEGRFFEFNDAFATFHRFANKEECARTFAEYPCILDVFFADGTSAPVDMWAVPRALRGETVTNAEYGLRRKDTGENWIGSYSFSPIRDKEGRIAGSVVVARDITEIKRAENALRASEARFRKVFENAATGVVIGDWDGHLEQCNPAFCALLGYEDGELAGRPFASIIASEDLRHTLDRVDRLKSGEFPFFEDESRYLRKDGQPVWVHKFVSLIGDATGKPTHVVVLVTDISARKRAHEEVRQLNAELELRVRERTAQLEASNKELEAFAYSVSHDLRAPLRGIDGWSLALVEDYGASLDERAHKYLTRVRTETQRMGLLIDDLLKLSRITRAEMQLSGVDLSNLAHDIARQLGESNGNRSIAFVIQPGLNAQGDARLLEVALTNLFANAVKFSGPRAEARIEFGGSRIEDETIFYVRDNGVGFDMAHARNLFGVFQRLHKASEFPGTGVGLATVQRIIRRHGGRIWAEAQPDLGATFYFTLGVHEGEYRNDSAG